MALAIFDLDGTLLDSRADLCAAVNALRRSYGLPPLDLATVTGYIGHGLRRLVHRSLQGHPADLDEAIRRCSAYYGEHLHEASTLYPGVPEGLRTLAAEGWTMAVCSNKPEAWCRSLVGHFRLARLFAEVAGGDSYPEMKPDPAPLLGIMGGCEATAEATWVVGDSATDVEAARDAGARSVFVSYGYSTPGGLTPDHSASTFAEAVSVLRRACPCPGA